MTKSISNAITVSFSNLFIFVDSHFIHNFSDFIDKSFLSILIQKNANWRESIIGIGQFWGQLGQPLQI
jgi:hypothetical protein